MCNTESYSMSSVGITGALYAAVQLGAEMGKAG